MATKDTVSNAVKVQLASKYTGKVRFPVYVEAKFDGIRVVLDGNRGIAYSRTGKLLSALHEAAQLWQRLTEGLESWERVVDCEYGNDWTNSMAATGKEVIPISDLAVFYMFDLPECEGDYLRRKEALETVYERVKARGGGNVFQYVSYERVDDEAGIERVYHAMLEKGYEGLMIKRNAPYKGGRSVLWQKYKPEETIDCVIEGCIEGQGKFAGMLGALVVREPDRGIVFNVGTGFTDAQRRKIWKDREEVIGHFVEIAVQPNWEQIGLPRFPRFKRFRPDKD